MRSKGCADFDRHDAVKELDERGIGFQPFPELEKAVESDVKLLRESKVVPDDVVISGWVYEVETGRVRRVN